MEDLRHPTRYQSSKGIECWDAIEAATEDLTGIDAVDTGNIIKYAWRWKRKNGAEDIRKIIVYAEHLLKRLEGADTDGDDKKLSVPVHVIGDYRDSESLS